MKGLMVSNGFVDVRVGRIALAMREYGITHDVLCTQYPPQFQYAYDAIAASPYFDYSDITRRVAASDADIIQVHGEVHGAWVMSAVREGAQGRPVVLNVHDLTCSRDLGLPDVWEPLAFDAADAFVWASPTLQADALGHGLAADGKPSVVVTNYVSSSVFVAKPVLPHIGGVCYGGGIAKRGDTANDRDLSAIADALGGNMHIYSGSGDVDYGIMHPSELNYRLYIERLASHDWGFSGHPEPRESWVTSMPTKVTEYFAAGTPLIAMNTPNCIDFCERGMGIYCDSLKDVARAAKTDPKPYRKNVLRLRSQFTTERIIEPLVELYRSLS